MTNYTHEPKLCALIHDALASKVREDEACPDYCCDAGEMGRLIVAMQTRDFELMALPHNYRLGFQKSYSAALLIDGPMTPFNVAKAAWAALGSQ